MASEHHVHATARFQIFEQGLELRFSRGNNLELHRGKSTFATVRHRNIGFADPGSVLLHNFHDKLGEIRSGIADHLDDVVTGKLDLRRFWLTHARYPPMPGWLSPTTLIEQLYEKQFDSIPKPFENATLLHVRQCQCWLIHQHLTVEHNLDTAQLIPHLDGCLDDRIKVYG